MNQVSVLPYALTLSMGALVILLLWLLMRQQRVASAVTETEADTQRRILSRAVEQSGSIVFITDEHGVIEYVNPRFTEVTGYTSEEALGKTPRLVRSDLADQALYDELWVCLNAGHEWRGEFHNRRKDGDLFWVQSVISPVLDARGKLTHYVAIQEDITEQKRIAEEEHRQRLLAEALRANAEAINSTRDLDEVLAHVLESAGRAAFAPYDLGSIVLLEGDGVRAMHALRKDGGDPTLTENVHESAMAEAFVVRQVRACGCPVLVPDVVQESDWTPIQGWEWVRSIVAVPIRLENDVIGVLSLAAAVPDAFDQGGIERLNAFANQAANAIKTARSFATIQRYTDQLEARNRELDAFSHTVAHDLRSPLALVIGYLNLAVEEPLPPPGDYFVTEALQAAERMNDMIENMLLLAQLRNAEEVMRREDLAIVAAAAVARFRVEIADRGIQVELAPDLPPVMGFGPWIEEVLANLVSNAIKYIGKDNPRPHITIRAYSNGQQTVRCEVQDNGVGIPVANQAKLFDMFSRFHKEEARGYGIGLSIVASIIAKLGGEVGVESTPGEGSTFWFTLHAAE